MSNATEDILTAVGPRLRALRLRRNVTLAELSDRTGIAVSTLSRLESGQRRPNLELLLPLAREHGVPLDELVGAPPTGDPRIHLRPITRFGMTILPLSSETGGLRAFKHVIPASSPRTEPSLRSHEGYEWVYVLKGELRLILGEHDLILPAGEAAEFNTQFGTDRIEGLQSARAAAVDARGQLRAAHRGSRAGPRAVPPGEEPVLEHLRRRDRDAL